MNWKQVACFTTRFRSLTNFAVIILALSSCKQTNEPTGRAWNLVWQQEFDGPTGQTIDTTRWGYDIGTDWGNAQQEYDTRRPENVSLDGQGNLAIVAIKETYLGSNYTSGRISTRGKFQRTYGRFEARIKMPWGQGIWPAFWLLGANIDSAGWPQCGEIDIMEYRGQEPMRVNGSVHGPGYSGVNNIGGRYNLVDNRFDNDFHVFSVEWGPDYINWFVDGNLYHDITPNDTNGKWVFDHPFYIILNLAVGGHYVGSPSAATVFPQTMLVDYVRVYEEVK
jgi:beta-glucanase (GH16 family)